MSSGPLAGSSDRQPADSHTNGGPAHGEAPHSNWVAWCTRSMLSFSCPLLEEEFQAYQSRPRNVLTCICMLIRIAGYGAIFKSNEGAAYRHMLPPLTLPLLCQLLPSILTIALLCCFPSYYAKHHLALSAASTVAEWVTFFPIRQMLMWGLLVESTLEASPFVHQVRGFVKENMFFCMAWFMHAADPAPCLSVLGTLLVNLASNRAICASPLWPQQSVTLSPTPLAAAQALSAGLLDAAEPFYHASNRSLCTCSIVLALWQLLGSLLALLGISTAEIVRRRAFLRLPTVQTRLGPHDAAEALHWPCGGMSLPSRCVGWAVGLFLAHAVLLALLSDNMIYP